MSPATAKARLLITALWLLVAASAVTCVFLPLIAVRSLHTEFKHAYSGYHAQILATQLPGPVFTLLCSFALLLAVIFRKRLPWWLWLVPLLGVVFTTHAVRKEGISHDFSHVVFQECSDTYGSWITSASIIAGLALLATAAIARREQVRPIPS